MSQQQTTINCAPQHGHHGKYGATQLNDSILGMESVQTGPINCDSVGGILLCNNAHFSAPHYPEHTAIHALDGVQPSPTWPGPVIM
jgi:hypothetical protein